MLPNNDPKLGPGGGPTRAQILPSDPALRKMFPIATGVLDYFPDAIAGISFVSYVGNHQHNPGMDLQWTRGKSTDEADTFMRHFEQRGTIDVDLVPHSLKMGWRVLAQIQKEIEENPEPYRKMAEAWSTRAQHSPTSSSPAASSPFGTPSENAGRSDGDGR